MSTKCEEYETGTGQLVPVHAKENCQDSHCVIHNPSDHNMKYFPTNWRRHEYLMERVCPHGIGHPDPDHIQFMRDTAGEKVAETQSVHGCDGCCSRPEWMNIPYGIGIWS